MRAALVTSFGAPPTCQNIAPPTPHGRDEVLIDVLAVGLHPRVRSQADGSHYTSSHELPLVPGIDGVGRAHDGRLRYFVLPDTTMGAMAEQTVVDLRRSIALPDGSDPVLVAAAMNPALSAWLALRRRIALGPGQQVLVLGATGNAGRMAVQIAKHLGASRVIGAGRASNRLGALTDLGADLVVDLADADGLGHAAAEIDVVLDYLWGEPTSAAMTTIVANRADESRPLNWIEVGSVAGPAAAIPSAALRAARMQIVGSGQGSVPTADILAELPVLAAEITNGTFAIDARTVALTDVESAWRDPDRTQRMVVLCSSSYARDGSFGDQI